MPKHLSLPIRVGNNGALVALEQDSELEVAQSVALLVSTHPGERRSAPDYGLPDPVFGGVDHDVVVAVIAEHEERADPALVDQLAEDLVDQAIAVYPAEVTTTTDEEVSD